MALRRAPSGLSPVALTRDRVRFLNPLEPLSHIGDVLHISRPITGWVPQLRLFNECPTTVLDNECPQRVPGSV